MARKKEIFSFKQQKGEVIYDAWERFNILLKRCPGHKFSDMDIMQGFTMGLTPDTQMLLDASTRGTMKIKRAGEVRELIDNLPLNEYRAQTDEEDAPKKKGMIYINIQDALLASNKLLSLQLETIAKRLEAREVTKLSARNTCDFWEQAHESGACLSISLGLSEEQVKCMGNYSRQQWNPYFNTYNLGWAYHLNFSYRSNNCL